MKTHISSVLLTILICCTSLTTFAGIARVENGTLRGSVFDKETGEPLIAANVILKQNGQFVSGVATNVDGLYSMKVQAGVYDLEVAYVGYQKKIINDVEIKPNQVTTLKLLVAPATQTLECVEIVSEKRQSKVAMSIQKLSPRQLSAIPGVSVRRKNRRNKQKQKQQTPVQTSVTPRPKPVQKVPTVGGESDIVNYISHNDDNHVEPASTEQYDAIEENPFKEVKHAPLSTFSIDVDVASYANMRRFINNHQRPPKDAVRIEEMVNYFDYDYPQPDGEHPFAIVTEMSECPWNDKNRLVHVGIQGKEVEIKKLPANNLVFLVDVSGSMSSHHKLPLVKNSLKMLVKKMRAEDRIALVTYAGNTRVVLESTPGNQKQKIIKAINDLNSGGSTAGAAGIVLAYEQAMKNHLKDGNNRVILATDGDFNVGITNDNDLVRMIEEKRENDVFLTVLGYGMGNYKDGKMEKLADKGNGNYAYIDNISEAKKVLVTEMSGTLLTIAKDVKIQIEFNPTKVASYKLIGYENRLLNDEDFNDDTKDAGELGSGHTVTALYEVVPASGALEAGISKPNVDPLRYQTNQLSEEATSDEIMTVKFRYKAPKGKVSKLITHYVSDRPVAHDVTSDNFKFSAAVAEFGLLLRNSKYKGTASYDQVVHLAKQGKGKDAKGYRAEFIRLVEKSELQSE